MGAGFILSLHVAVDLSEFTIWDKKLVHPWEDRHFEWLPEPQGRKFPGNMYQVPRSYLEYTRDVVINHRRVLKRGHSLDGLRLGFGPKPIPDSYHSGAIIDASLVLIDEMGRGFSTLVNLWVNRIAKHDRKPAKAKTRRPIFENQDWFEAELVQK